MGQQWTNQELKEFDRYFNTNLTQMTLYQRIYAINPSRPYSSISRKIRKLKSEGREKVKISALKSLRIGYLDIEASDLNGDFGYMLSWYIKVRGKNQYDFAVITKKEIENYETDKRITSELLTALDNYDVLYTHWGRDRRFDFPFIRTRAYKWGLESQIPERDNKFIMDTWDIAKNKLKLHNNRLDSIAEAVGIKNVKKTPLSAEKWQLASLGHPGSLEYIALHNKRDVQILERIHRKLEPVERPIYRSI